ncbi:MAG: hydrogenase iron-sulfur subunit [Pseudomonadota bacterium]|nr:MAG: hydrogenase iron-sulfur subunit [Pseudomonadota bacterium]
MLKAIAHNLFERLERAFDYAFTPAWNPFHYLGALGWYFFWIVLVSGIYLFIFFDTGIVHAYEAVEAITHAQWYAGGVMRSLHRYASDALVVVVFVHILREWAKDRYRGARWFAWFTGVPLLWFIYICGISGYWLVWDELAQYIAVATTEWLDTLGVFGEPLARNFLNHNALSDRFFTLMVFVHILVPLLMLFLMWIHIQRNSHALVNPPLGLALGTLITMTVMSLMHPALSHPPADLDRVVTTANLDWYYLAVYPLLDVMPGRWLWAALGIGTLLLLITPWVPPLRRPPVAAVNLPNCNGCARCVADCPFNAIEMRARTDGLPFEQEAVVDAGNCVACGVCAGACPTSTPFRRASELVPGIDLPDVSIAALREQTLAACAKLAGEARVLIYGCEHGPPIEQLASESVATVRLRCSGQLPPAFIDFALTRGHVDGVLIAGCRPGDCHYRLGGQWARARIAATRDPQLRARVPRERLELLWSGMSGLAKLERTLAALRARLVPLGSYQRPHQPKTAQESGNGN